MKCPNCDATVRPEWKLCIYCGFDLRKARDPHVERAGIRERGPSRTDRYVDDDHDGYEQDEDDEYVGRRGNGEPPSRAGRTSARGRDRAPERDEPPAVTDDSLIAPIYPPRGERGDDRGGERGVGYGRSGRGYDEDDEDHEDDDGIYDKRRPQPPRPSQRRVDDRDQRSNRQDRGSRPGGNRFNDPLDDPRAPGFLRGSAAPRDVGRPNPSSRSGRDVGYDAPGGGRRPPSNPSRQGRQDFADYPDEPRRGGPLDRDNARGYGSSSRTPPRRSPEPRGFDPQDDSLGMPAFASAEEPAFGWTDPSAEWGIAPSEDYSVVQPGVRGASGGRNSRNVRNSRDARRPNARGDAPAKGGQRGKFIALAVFLALLLVGGGVLMAPKLLSKSSPTATELPSAFATYTPGATPTPAANYTIFTSKRSAYILTYPQTWTESEQPSGSGDNLDVFAAPGNMPMLRVEQATGFAGQSDEDVISGEVASAKQIDSTAVYTEDLSAATTVALGGEEWMRREFDVTSSGVKYHMAIMSCHHNGKGYVIVLVTAPDDFAKESSGPFKTMLASFRFVG